MGFRETAAPASKVTMASSDPSGRCEMSLNAASLVLVQALDICRDTSRARTRRRGEEEGRTKEKDGSQGSRVRTRGSWRIVTLEKWCETQNKYLNAN